MPFVFKNSNSNLQKKKKIFKMFILCICKCVNNGSHLVEILKILELYEFTDYYKIMVIDTLKEKHLNNSLAWAKMAARKSMLLLSDGAPEVVLFRKKCHMYERTVHPIIHPYSYDSYLSYLIGVNQKNPNIKEFFDKMNTKLEEAHQELFLRESQYIAWYNLFSDANGQLEILIKATEALPMSCLLWNLRLKVFISTDQKIDAIKSLFEEAVTILREKGTSLWIAFLRYAYHLWNWIDILEIFEAGSLSPYNEVAVTVRPMYLEWICDWKPIWYGRDLYNRLVHMKPHSILLHRIMLKKEMSELGGNMEEIMHVFKLACDQFGSEHADFWYNRISFMCAFDTGTFNAKLKKIILVQIEAAKALRNNSELFVEFHNKYETIISHYVDLNAPK